VNADIKIHPVQKSDYVELVEVWESSVRATHHFLSEEDIQYFKPLILNEYLDAVSLFCTRDADGRITGFAGIADNKIEMLFVQADERGKYYGKTLLQHAIGPCNARKVDVNEQNDQAVKFYEHLGFEVIGRSPLDSLGKPFPLLHMQLL
jgi:putative acetyltransferase